MGAEDAKPRGFILETGEPKLQTIEDIFAWFDDDTERTLLISDRTRLPYWPRPEALYDLGFPQDLPLVEVIASGRHQDDKFKDYVYAYLGVIADENDPSKGKTKGGVRLVLPDGKSIVIYAWGTVLIARNIITKLVTLWDASLQPHFPTLPVTERRIGWSHAFINMSMSRPNDLKILASGFELFGPDSIELTELTVKRRGGDQRPKWKKELWSRDSLKRYAILVKDLAPKWSWVKSNEYDSKFFAPQEWVDEVRKRPEFAGLFGNSNRLTDDLLLRITDSNLSDTDREPTALACIHAAYELGIIDRYAENAESPSAETLRDYYLKGVKLIPNDPTKQS
jgi:hypothetical protein